MLRVEFGYLPERRDFSVGDITIATLPDLDTKRSEVAESGLVEGEWTYAPQAARRVLMGGVRDRPYSNRVFALPKTHFSAGNTTPPSCAAR